VATQRRDLAVNIDADPTAFEKGTARAGKSASAYERELARLERQQARTDRAMNLLGRGMLVAGAAIAAGLALSVKAAIDWESAWAGVLKTVDGTPEQMAALEEEIRGLTAVLPASHREIAAVAEAAGQLGVQRQDVAAFTKTMIDMGEATNLSSDEAATAIARFMNIMQTAPANVDRLASAIVDLGNKGATTEAEITEMSLRIAGAGRTIGLSEQQVLAFAAALSNVGIKAEAGGTAISKVFLEIDTAVSAGGDNLETFAQTAGMTADEFRRAYEQDAGAAITAFVVGLGKVQESGGDVNAVLNQLGLTEIRVSDALRRLAGSGDNLTTTLQISNQAWDANEALAAEAERRYGTTAAQAAIARNQLNDLAIDMGTTLLPVIGASATRLSALLDVLQDLPEPVKVLLAVLATASAALLVVGGAALIAVPKIVALRTALDQLTAAGGRAALVSSAFRGVGAFLAGPWGIALGVAVTALTAFGIAQANTKAKIDEMSKTLDAQTGQITDNTRAWLANKLEEEGVLAAAERLGLDLETVVSAILGEQHAIERVNAVLAEHNQELGTTGILVAEYRRQLEGQGLAAEDVAAKTLDYQLQLEAQNAATDKVSGAVGGLTEDLTAAQEATRRQAEATGEAVVETEALTPATRDLATAFDVSAGAADDVADAVDKLDEELKQLFERVFGLQNAQDDLADAFDSLTEQIQRQQEEGVKGAGALDGMSAAARDNRDAAQELLEKYGQLVQETIKQTGSQEEAEAVVDDFRAALEDLAEQTGTNVEDLEGYNDVVGDIERLIEVTFENEGVTTATREAARLRDRLNEIDRQVNIAFSVSGAVSAGSVRLPGMQHGGEVHGPAGIDRVPRMLTAGEIMIRREVAQPNRAALLALNATGRFPVGGGMAGGGGSVASGGDTIHVHLKSYSDRFSTKQVLDDLAFRGAV
jgi:TP901 family phage tail tape measure protein